MNKEEKYDGGPLLTLSEGLNLEKLKNNVSIEDRFIDLIVKNINKARWGQRFAVNWRANAGSRIYYLNWSDITQ